MSHVVIVCPHIPDNLHHDIIAPVISDGLVVQLLPSIWCVIAAESPCNLFTVSTSFLSNTVSQIANYGAPPPSIGFPDYIYPDEEVCQMYQGVPCTQDATLCCYNAAKWCPDGVDSATCEVDNGGET
jgi:hypothetical protein